MNKHIQTKLTTLFRGDTARRTKVKDFLSTLGNHYIPIHSVVINRMLGNKYKSILTKLEKAELIEIDKQYIVGDKSRSYKLVDHISSLDVYHEIKEEDKVEYYINEDKELLPYQKEIVEFTKYSLPFLSFPSLIELKEYAILCEENKQLFKGKVLTWNKTTNSYSIPGGINIYSLRNRFRIILGDSNCIRINTFFTNIPKWTRSAIKINGNNMVECDFSCLHPNLIIQSNGYPESVITHQDIATYLNITLTLAKEENLSFWNKAYKIQGGKDMVHSPLYKFYEDNYPLALGSIVTSKIKGDNTSEWLFNKETELMSIICKELTVEKLPGIYVYDAIYCDSAQHQLVKDIMVQCAKTCNFNLVAK